ncbi:hypothetical protein BI364_04995 [Acidihalobacter yilgarnensis]|uniref:Uncharacterized protein n=1 Tax=Acidihalobacter yilgarnensis TaxID=2819280 RepID=A0A1D8ILT3_9GAMM|nr:hypothetical protein BI364_04995 [Acidihalobacter yilgarnensis]
MIDRQGFEMACSSPRVDVWLAYPRREFFLTNEDPRFLPKAHRAAALQRTGSAPVSSQSIAVMSTVVGIGQTLRDRLSHAVDLGGARVRTIGRSRGPWRRGECRTLE